MIKMVAEVTVFDSSYHGYIVIGCEGSAGRWYLTMVAMVMAVGDDYHGYGGRWWLLRWRRLR